MPCRNLHCGYGELTRGAELREGSEKLLRAKYLTEKCGAAICGEVSDSLAGSVTMSISTPRDVFVVSDWLKDDNPDFLPITQPRAVGCWTKDSATQGGAYQYGSTAGKILGSGLYDTSRFHHASCCESVMQAGRPSYRPPQLPVDLNAGYPESYIKKQGSDEATPVEVIIRGAQSAGVKLASIQICTFR